jgi:argininosuccinate lyase
VADYLVARGVPFRQAHEIVGGIVRDLLAKQRDFSQLRLDEWQAYSPQFAADVLDAVTPDASVAARKTPQSTSPEAVRQALGETRRWLGSHQ